MKIRLVEKIDKLRAVFDGDNSSYAQGYRRAMDDIALLYGEIEIPEGEK